MIDMNIKQYIGEWWYRQKTVTVEGVYSLVMEILRLKDKEKEGKESGERRENENA